MLFGSPFELFQSHFGCVAHPKDPGPLAVSRISAQFFLLNSFLSSNLGRLGLFFFLPFVSWALKPAPSWILGFKSFRPTILCFCELNPFSIFYFPWSWPKVLFLWALCYDFLNLNKTQLYIIFKNIEFLYNYFYIVSGSSFKILELMMSLIAKWGSLLLRNTSNTF